jgi:O-antigen/teichoic acid export membrane protein
VVTNVLLVGVWKRGIQGIVESQFITSAVLAMGVLWLLVRGKRFRFSWSQFRALVSFGVPLVPGGIAAWCLTVMSQYFIRHFSGMHEVGLFGLGWRFGTLISMVLVIPFRTAWFPFMFSIRDEGRADRMYSLTLTYFLFAAVFLALGISILARELVLAAATREYLAGYPMIPILAAAYVAYGVFNTADVGIMLSGKTMISAVLCVGAAIVQTGLQLAWVPGHGAMGAAWAALISYLLLAAGVIVWSNRLHPVRYEGIRILKIVGTALVLYFVSTRIVISSIVPAVAVKTCIWFVYPVALWSMRFFHPQEIRALRSALDMVVHRSRRS